MRRSLAGLAVAATAATVLGTTAIPAFADPVPSDCTVTKVAWDTRSMTCTNRPATQHWAFTMVCTSIGGHETYDGNVVTGNGTSTVSCGAYPNDRSYQIQYYN